MEGQLTDMSQEERMADLIYHEKKAMEYKPSKQEALMQHEIQIQFLSRGCIIRVGCKSVPFSSTEDAINELQKYFENPFEVQQQWRDKLS
jgi:hypothetical protein